MIVLFDASPLIATELTRTSWRILGLMGRQWGVHIKIPRVVAAEAVGKLGRDLAEEELSPLRKVARKYKDSAAFAAALREVEDKISREKEQFMEDARSLGAELIEPAAVPVLEMVRRQVERRRPCDSKGDGYRDTLNWLTVLDVAERNPDEEIVWVTSDTDFGNPQARKLHEELLAEAAERGVADRLRVASSIRMVVDDLIKLYKLPEREHDARLELSEKAIRTFILESLLPGLKDGYEETKSATAINMPGADEIELGEMAGLEAGGVVCSFSTAVEVEYGDFTPVMSYTLLVSGVVTTDKFDQPREGDINEVEPEDGVLSAEDLLRGLHLPAVSGLSEYLRHSNSDVLAGLHGISEVPSMMDGLREHIAAYESTLSEHAKAAARLGIEPSLLSAINKIDPLQEVRESVNQIQKAMLGPQLLTAHMQEAIFGSQSLAAQIGSMMGSNPVLAGLALPKAVPAAVPKPRGKRRRKRKPKSPPGGGSEGSKGSGRA
ncbi:hypothetical protein EDD29_0082 [Actinocorallia herbida]|uniref:DUF4935 domain-containing protein n=1 Tax=Actinocorallia herbida TaxID=58109 RepID=A0A3N1CMR1_9ACTN|nr:PIN domain-containing protein [Actinocorallia herbida]ROO82601.1 hypothetical protein EDD29_0082 [Actinocorallia herbida]